MALFDEDAVIVPAPRRRVSRATIVGLWALVTALVVLLGVTFLPTPYVIQQPGPVYNTLGAVTDAEGEEVPLIAVDGAETYPTDGVLDLTTVVIEGDRERSPSWFQLAAAWFDPSQAVLPIDDVYPDGQTTQERSEQSAALFVDSQEQATAAALGHLGYELDSELSVQSFTPDSPSEQVLDAGDVILAAQGEAVADATELRSIINGRGGDPVELTVDRDGVQQSVSITPARADIDGEASWVIGIGLAESFTFPIDVEIQLDNVGGPSAGMMFALGIIDTLTPGELTGGEPIAGTGEIRADGAVGPIGGIRQKLWGAERAGADYFLAPEANCDEVVGHVPGGIRVFSVGTLGDALTAVEAVAAGDDLDALPTCT